jgi:hypothetical protein
MAGSRSKLVTPWRRAYRLKPPAHVHLSMGLSAEMAGSGRGRRFRIPLEQPELRVSALDYEPVIRAIGNVSTDFTAEFLKRCHGVTLPGKSP